MNPRHRSVELASDAAVVGLASAHGAAVHRGFWITSVMIDGTYYFHTPIPDNNR